MKLNQKGWGFEMMAFLMSILICALYFAIYYIYKFYQNVPVNLVNNRICIIEVIK